MLLCYGQVSLVVAMQAPNYALWSSEIHPCDCEVGGGHDGGHQMAVLSHRRTAIGAVTSSRVGHLGKLYLAKQPIFYFRYMPGSGSQGKLN